MLRVPLSNDKKTSARAGWSVTHSALSGSAPLEQMHTGSLGKELGGNSE